MGTSSICTVHAPHEESSHPRLEPVSCRSCRKASSRSLLGSIASSCNRPLTRSSMSCFFIRSNTQNLSLRRTHAASPLILPPCIRPTDSCMLRDPVHHKPSAAAKRHCLLWFLSARDIGGKRRRLSCN